MKRYLFGRCLGWIGLVGLLAMFFSSTALAGDSVKARMEARAPEIVRLKSQGQVGEDNQGYLEARGADAAGKAIVKEENQDRKLVYQAIAAKTGSSPAQVGQRAAAKRAQVAGAGEWLQSPSGDWYQK